MIRAQVAYAAAHVRETPWEVEAEPLIGRVSTVEVEERHHCPSFDRIPRPKSG